MGNPYPCSSLEERHAFECLGVYEVVPWPKGRKIISSKWVFHIKHGPDSAVQKYKAWVVGWGFTQVKGVDYDETFAPVAKLASLRTILAIATNQDLEVHQMDVKSAYLNGALQEEIYMKPPPSFNIPEDMIFHLIKAVYGTKQGGCVWYNNIQATLHIMGYHHTIADHAVFTCTTGVSPSIIALYINDITMVCRDLDSIQQDKAIL